MITLNYTGNFDVPLDVGIEEFLFKIHTLGQGYFLRCIKVLQLNYCIRDWKEVFFFFANV